MGAGGLRTSKGGWCFNDKAYLAVTNEKESLWVKWVHSHYLKKQTLWEFNPKGQGWCLLISQEAHSVKCKHGFIGDNWKLTSDGQERAKSGYDWLLNQKTKSWWSETTSNRINSALHSVLVWIIMHQKLQVFCIIAKFQPALDIDSPICKAAKWNTGACAFWVLSY